VLEHRQPLWTKTGAEDGRGKSMRPLERGLQTAVQAFQTNIDSSRISARFVTGAPCGEPIVTMARSELQARRQIALVKYNLG
jgi:hypothetical protein